jgi:hypothetical protein
MKCPSPFTKRGTSSNFHIEGRRDLIEAKNVIAYISTTY